ncbi:hypothetical protein N9023_06370 [Opitutaceae bacterium]|nr:hypothetical protein [Opitutaceae bacterium]
MLKFITYIPHPHATDGSTMRLATVLNQRQSVFVRDLTQSRQVRGLTKNMNRQDRFRAGCNRGFDQLRIHQSGLPLHIHKNGNRILMQDARRRSPPRIRRRDHFIAIANLQSGQRAMERRVTGTAGKHFAATMILRNSLFCFHDLRGMKSSQPHRLALAQNITDALDRPFGKPGKL